MKCLGLLGILKDAEGRESFCVLNPEEEFYIVPPEQAPDGWEVYAEKAEANNDFAAVGFIMDAKP